MITLYSFVESCSEKLVFSENIDIFQILKKADIKKDHTLVIGRKTWFSIPLNIRKNIDYQTIVLSMDKTIGKTEYVKNVKFMDFSIFCQKEVYNKSNYAILGGITINNLFLKSKFVDELIMYYNQKSGNINTNKQPIEFSSFKVIGIYTLENSNDISIHLKQNKATTLDILSKQSSLSKLFKSKKPKKDTNTISNPIHNFYNNIIKTGFREGDYLKNFGLSVKIDVNKTIPLFVEDFDWRECINKFLWDLGGNTRDGGTNIGWYWRCFGAEYSRAFSNTNKIDLSLIGGFDQIHDIIQKIKEAMENTNKTTQQSIILNSWDFSKKTIPPRNHFCQFYVSDVSGEKQLSLHIYSCKLNFTTQFQYDIFYYTTLLYTIAKKCGLTPKWITASYGEIYIPINSLNYTTQLSNIETQSILLTSLSLMYKNLNDISLIDFDFIKL